MRGRMRLAVGALALVVAGIPVGAASAAAASPVPPTGVKVTAGPEKPGPEKPKPGEPAKTGDQLRKEKRGAVEDGGDKAGRNGRDSVDLAALARKLGVSEEQLVTALTHAKKSTSDPGHLSRATVRAFARELGISRWQARKVLVTVFQAPAKKG